MSDDINDDKIWGPSDKADPFSLQDVDLRMCEIPPGGVEYGPLLMS